MPDNKKPRMRDGYRTARVDARICVPDTWTDEEATGWVAKQLGFPGAEDQKHPRGFPLPCIGEFGITKLMTGGARQLMEHQLTGRVYFSEGNVVLKKATTGVVSSMAIGEAEVHGANVPIERLFRPFNGKRVMVTIQEFEETS